VLPFSGLWYLEVHLAIDFAKYQSRVLRCCTESETHANTFSDPNRDSYCYAPSDSAAASDAATAPDAVTAKQKTFLRRSKVKTGMAQRAVSASLLVRRN
jgi:hypothetical protein